MVDIKRVITETINEYLEDNGGIQAVIFDFDLTLVNTLPFKGVDREYVRNTNDISQIKHLIPQTTVYAGIKYLILWLLQNGIKIGVVSNRHSSIVNATLRYHGIKADVVIGERLNSDKSTRMREALSKLGISPKNAIYVGDSPWDNAEAHKAGMEFVGATWGNRKLKMGYNNPMEIIKYIDYINN